ncbi:MAG: DNA repair protein RecO [Phycisphaeraceae bacterium]|nr:DNA repair protein RecO [Phycisphaeraceae bacterium]
MPAIHDDAVCIRHWDWSETSQAVSLFTRGHGLVRALAKGSRRAKSPYSGGVEMLTRGEAGLIVRPNTELALLTEWDLRETYPALRRSLAAFNAGMYFADLVQRFVHDHDAHTALFDALASSLAELGADGTEAMLDAVVRFQWAVLREAGFRPLLGESSTGADVPEAEVLVFDPEHGGVRTVVGPGPHSGWKVRRGTIELLRRVAGIGVGGAGEGMEAETLLRAARLLGAYVSHVLGEEPPTQRPALSGAHSDVG